MSATPESADYSPRILWRLERRGHVVDALLMPHAQHIAVLLRLDGQAKNGKSFLYQSEALAWAEEQRLLHVRA